MDGDDEAPVGPGSVSKLEVEGDEAGDPLSHEASADEVGEGGPSRLCAGKHRELQVARAGKRRLFKGKARRKFLGWFAATGNVVWSAEKVGFSDKTIWRHRMNDPRFAEAFDRAFEQSVARNKAKMLERKIRQKPIEIDGGVGEAELEECDPAAAWPLIVEIERAKGRGGGAPVGRPPKAGRPPRVASNAEVRSALEKRLRAYGQRMRGAGREPPPWLPPAKAKRASGASPAAMPPAPPPGFTPPVAAQPASPSGGPPDCRAAAPPSPSGDGEDRG